MKRTRWVEPKWSMIKEGSRVRIRWPANQWKEGTVTETKEKSCLAHLDSGGWMSLDLLNSFEIQEEYETQSYL